MYIWRLHFQLASFKEEAMSGRKCTSKRIWYPMFMITNFWVFHTKTIVKETLVIISFYNYITNGFIETKKLVSTNVITAYSTWLFGPYKHNLRYFQGLNCFDDLTLEKVIPIVHSFVFYGYLNAWLTYTILFSGLFFWSYWSV